MRSPLSTFALPFLHFLVHHSYCPSSTPCVFHCLQHPIFLTSLTPILNLYLTLSDCFSYYLSVTISISLPSSSHPLPSRSPPLLPLRLLNDKMMCDIRIAREEGMNQKCLEHRLKLTTENESVLQGKISLCQLC
jgi:hypothetical protein